MSNIDERQEQHQRHMREMELIRAIARAHEQKALVEAWAFFVWGGAVIAATLFHRSAAASLTTQQALVRIWTPAVALGVAAEVVAWFIRMRRQSGSGLFKRSYQFLLGFCGLTAVLVLVLLTLIAEGWLTPALLLLLLSLPLLFHAQASFSGLFMEAGLAVLAGVALLAVDLPPAVAYSAAGILLGILLLVSGAHSLLLERLHRE